MYKVFLQHPAATVPATATAGSAGYDLSACVDDCVPAGRWKAVETGVVVQFPADCYLRIAPRSGLAFKTGIDVFAGVIDSDYTGTIKVILMNHGTEDFEVKVGDRIAQMIYERIYKPVLQVVDSMQELTATARGVGGFGSTGMGISTGDSTGMGISTGDSTGMGISTGDAAIEAWATRGRAADAATDWRSNDGYFQMFLNSGRQLATDKIATDVQNDIQKVMAISD